MAADDRAAGVGEEGGAEVLDLRRGEAEQMAIGRAGDRVGTDTFLFVFSILGLVGFGLLGAGSFFGFADATLAL